MMHFTRLANSMFFISSFCLGIEGSIDADFRVLHFLLLLIFLIISIIFFTDRFITFYLEICYYSTWLMYIILNIYITYLYIVVVM